jgi:hypothetical protein
MFDFDPRDYDSRDDGRHGNTPNRGNRDTSDDRSRDDDWSQPAFRPRDRDDDEAGRSAAVQQATGKPMTTAGIGVMMPVGRTGTATIVSAIERGAIRSHATHFPRELERELVRYRDREYTLRGSESRTLATVGAFRVVSSHDLRDHQPTCRPALRRPPTSPRTGTDRDRACARLP